MTETLEPPLAGELRDELVGALGHIPELAGAELTLTALSGGITNRNFLITVAGRPDRYVIRLAGNLPAYRGSLYLAMERDAERSAAAPVAELSTGYAQVVDGDTPLEVVERMRQESMLARFGAQGVDVTGIEAFTDDAMERLVNG